MSESSGFKPVSLLSHYTVDNRRAKMADKTKKMATNRDWNISLQSVLFTPLYRPQCLMDKRSPAISEHATAMRAQVSERDREREREKSKVN